MREPTKIPGVYRDADIRPNGWLCGEITAPYSKLVELLGEPNVESDGYKVSTEWSLVLEDGTDFRLYDYKETSLYDEGLPTVDEFRALPAYSWHIGAALENGSPRVRTIQRLLGSVLRG